MTMALLQKTLPRISLAGRIQGSVLKTHSGYMVQNKIRYNSIGQYLSRALISLQKVEYIKTKGKALLYTKYNEYFKENLKLSKALDFIALLVQHIPPARLHYIRYYGLYSFCSRGKWEDMTYVLRLAPEGWNDKQSAHAEYIEYEDNSVSAKAKRSAWARLIKKVYEVDPLIFPKCGNEMRLTMLRILV